jgi:transcriptional regulator with XRE-family HTH domain
MPPRKGQPAYAISDDWQDRVRDRIAEMGISQNELARRAHISKSALSEALMSGAVETTVMPEIHKALGWPMPQIVLHPDRLELLALYEEMSEFDKGASLERLRSQSAMRKRRG